jgi:hypothetical protein
MTDVISFFSNNKRFRRAADALERLHAAEHDNVPSDLCALKRELRRETARGAAL